MPRIVARTFLATRELDPSTLAHRLPGWLASSESKSRQPHRFGAAGPTIPVEVPTLDVVVVLAAWRTRRVRSSVHHWMPAVASCCSACSELSQMACLVPRASAFILAKSSESQAASGLAVQYCNRSSQRCCIHHGGFLGWIFVGSFLVGLVVYVWVTNKNSRKL